MWQWLTDNHGAVSAFTSILMLGVWMAYLQLFYVNFRHHDRLASRNQSAGLPL